MRILLLLYAMFCLEVKLVEHFVNYLCWISYLFDYLQGANVITFTVYVNLSSCLVLPVWRLYTSLRLFKLLEGSWIEFRFSGLCSKPFYPLSSLTGPWI